MSKRYGKPTAKSGELKVQYGRIDGINDLYILSGNSSDKHDQISMHSLLNRKPFDHFNQCVEKSFLEELESLGYDIKTLKISIQKSE